MRTHLRARVRRGRGVIAAVAALCLTAAVAAPVSAAPDAGPVIKANQVAYVPGVAKQATVVTSSGSPVAWTLRNSAGATVASGTTVVRGADSLSGDSVHTVDFSSFDTAGTGYTLAVAGATSAPFDISA